MWTWLEKLLGRTPPRPKGPFGIGQLPAPRKTTLEILASQGHGKTSFLWGLMYMTRRLSGVWPQYAGWSQDPETENAIQSLCQAMINRELPAEDASDRNYHLLLRSMQRWGDRRLLVKDDRDPVFGGANGAAPGGREVNWGVPVCWLLSLPNLGDDEAQLIDVRLNNLVRARLQSGWSFEAQPLKLIVVLTKADRIPNLPTELRRYLKDDPLAIDVKAEAELLAHGLRPGDSAFRFDDKAVRSKESYLDRLWEIHGQIAAWLGSTLAGSLLERRAGAQHIDLRFCLVSATGSDLCSDGHMEINWRPHRVLDPLFWALELESR